MSAAQDFRNLSLNDVPAAVTEELRIFLDQRNDDVAKIGAPVTRAVEHLHSFVLNGGKRVRPLYGWAGFVGGGGLENSPEDPHAVLRAVSSLEFIQACALIHDDIIDSSDTRRGNPTVHRTVEKLHADSGWKGNSLHFGQSTAILIGDLALVWAEDLWRYSGLSTEALERAAEPWRAMRTEVIGGQLLDINLEATGDESPALANAVNRFKTAAYTIERPLHLGAALAGAPEKTISAFRGYGHDIGIAFQLRDDLLGVFGDPEITGKPAGDDLREGKRTVLLSLALARADEADPTAAAALRAGVGTVTDPTDINKLATIIKDTGAVEQIEQQITTLTESGLAYLTAAGVDKHVHDRLRELAIRATERRK
ncbi:polyprenyl synthetase family protein [Corynebacterium cystitidis]|uniref:Geranylgeranyl diphosphate synthase, type I n=1 Tax=Corynebacterium cystitidis DSM 20524 TaxID=1121357 RepID=A0A1H9NNY9_9CORY|nr:polyprenyl synthetase family protein [Corynebacterium cystitidis]WJY82791.1 (2E,6E)-farnesyl diphosphate synthase [Corynebacterium cystitidis DSM 20524]SER37612.1 geranylgeranyl diphosphate synthase, type I [Corynebacterium cystitidis DSM 20524]SNV70478.1 polyprenyl diphosphate synthase [Corynebacterium cystitidis]